jgi:hypothetical protein
VTELVPKGEAERLKVGLGDFITGIGGSGTAQYDAIMQVFQSNTTRPLRIQFQRASANAQAGPKGTFAKARSKVGLPQKSSATNLSNAEREARRAQQLASVEQRENKWDKKIAQGKQSTYRREKAEAEREANSNGNEEKEQTAEQIARVQSMGEEARRYEAANVAQLGYNPYEVVKSGADASRNAVSNIKNGTAGNFDSPAAAPRGGHEDFGSGRLGGPSGQPMAAPGVVQPPTTAVESEDERQLREAMALSMLEVGPSPALEQAVSLLQQQGADKATAAAKILSKLLGNVVANPSEEKYHKVRLSNNAIKAKLVAVPGAVEVRGQ